MKESVIYQQITREARASGWQEGHEEGLGEGIEQGLEQGFQQATTKLALNLLKHNMSVEQTAELTGLSLEQVQRLQLEL